MTVARAGWRVGPWPALAWLETTLKLGGVGVGVAALVAAPRDGAHGEARLAQALVLGALALGLLAAIADRVAEREVVGVAFILLSNVGHGCMLAAVALGDVDAHLLAFALLMLAGEAAKLAFLRRSGFRVRDVSPAVVYGLTAGYALGYVALAGLAAAGGA